MKKQMSAEDYRNDEAFSRSQLFKLSKSPAHFKYALENPEVETPALAFGTLAAQIDASGKIPISEDAFAQIQAMAESVMSNKYAAALLNGGEHEKSYFWTDKLTGLKLKCRPDCRTDLRSTSVIVDLKTTENADTDSFMHSCIKYGYDLQAAMYTQGVSEIERKPHRFVFIAVEKSPPYACNVLEADDFIIQKGTKDLNDYLYTLKECLKTGNWYSYNGKNGDLNVISLPGWLAREYE